MRPKRGSTRPSSWLLARVEIPANPEAAPPALPPLQFSSGPLTFRFGLFAGSQFVLEDNAFWGLAAVFAPTARYNEDRSWDELWLIPRLRIDYSLARDLALYAGFAPAATGTLGRRDLFDQGEQGRLSLENAYGGVRIGDAASPVSLDLSGGQQPYRLGSGFLIDLGAQNGNQRGALLVAPRRALEYSGLAGIHSGRFAADGFLLNYNEIGSDDPDTTLWGAKAELNLSTATSDEKLGLAYLHVSSSDMPYIRAPLTIIDSGRQGMQALNPYLRFRPLRDRLPGLTTALEAAYEWNQRIDLRAYGLSAEIGHQWQKQALMPRLSYAFRQFSSDDPSTAALERFDPLFYDGAGMPSPPDPMQR